MVKIRKIFSVLFWTAVCFCLANFVCGWRAFAVMSSSMEPACPAGSLVISKPVPFRLLKKGDIVTFCKEGGVTVTHRIVQVDQNKRYIETKGDGNQIQDTGKTFETDIIGRIETVIPRAGYLSLAIKRGGPALLFILAVWSGFRFLLPVFEYDKPL